METMECQSIIAINFSGFILLWRPFIVLQTHHDLSCRQHRGHVVFPRDKGLISGLQSISKQKRNSLVCQFFFGPDFIGCSLASRHTGTSAGSSSEVVWCFQESLVRFLVFKVFLIKRETLFPSINLRSGIFAKFQRWRLFIDLQTHRDLRWEQLRGRQTVVEGEGSIPSLNQVSEQDIKLQNVNIICDRFFLFI